MSTKRIGTLAQAWYKWKALRLPWRKRFLIGFDLNGNTYWEFRLTRSDERWRRIVDYPRSTYLSQVKVSPLWHQWLRHTREDPPSLREQKEDVVRQARMKYLAAEADARWEAKPRVMDDPAGAQPAPTLESGRTDQAKEAAPTRPSEYTATKKEETDTKDPWAKAKAQGPSEKWQPTAWTPTTTPKNR